MPKNKPRTLSKSRFKPALECPTSVFYSLDNRYVSTKDEDEFLQALAMVMVSEALREWV